MVYGWWWSSRSWSFTFSPMIRSKILLGLEFNDWLGATTEYDFVRSINKTAVDDYRVCSMWWLLMGPWGWASFAKQTLKTVQPPNCSGSSCSWSSTDERPGDERIKCYYGQTVGKVIIIPKKWVNYWVETYYRGDPIKCHFICYTTPSQRKSCVVHLHLVISKSGRWFFEGLTGNV